MTKEEKIEEIRQRARKNFSLGYNCTECVTEAVLSLVDTGLPPEAKKMATGFGGGIGLYGDTCGAIAGAIMAVSAVHGRSNLPEGEGREAWPLSLVQPDSEPAQREIRPHPLSGTDNSLADHLALPGSCSVLPGSDYGGSRPCRGNGPFGPG